MPCSNRHGARGFTIAEGLVVLVIASLVTTLVLTSAVPFFNAEAQMQAKVDTIQTSTALYLLQRNIRTSDVLSDYGCTTSPVACSQSSTLTQVTAVVLVSPFTGGDVVWDPTTGSTTAGKPTWQGFEVYWLVTGSDGESDLMRAFVGLSSPVQAPAQPTAVQAQNALSSAMSGNAGAMMAHGVTQLWVDTNTLSHVVGLKLVAQGTEGNHVNETSYRSDTYARN